MTEVGGGSGGDVGVENVGDGDGHGDDLHTLNEEDAGGSHGFYRGNPRC